MSVPASLPCRECGGEGCRYCNEGRAQCDQPSCTDDAVEPMDCSDEGGPNDWLVCERHGKEIRAARRNDRDDDSRPPAEPYVDEDRDARTDEAVEP